MRFPHLRCWCQRWHESREISPGSTGGSRGSPLPPLAGRLPESCLSRWQSWPPDRLRTCWRAEARAERPPGIPIGRGLLLCAQIGKILRDRHPLARQLAAVMPRVVVASDFHGSDAVRLLRACRKQDHQADGSHVFAFHHVLHFERLAFLIRGSKVRYLRGETVAGLFSRSGMDGRSLRRPGERWR